MEKRNAMTKDEKLEIDALKDLVRDLIKSNGEFQTNLTKRVDALDKEYKPVTLEKDILATAQIAIQSAITQALIGYDSSLIKLTKSVVEAHSGQLRQLIEDTFSQVISTEEFKASLVDAFSHKVARTIISNNDGLFERVSNEMKHDPVFKSKIIMATANVVNECLINKKAI